MKPNEPPNPFQSLVRQITRDPRVSHLESVIQKELLHYDILFCMAQAGLLKNLVFQGGTALRLCYGGDRYSEDLDFAATESFSPDEFRPFRERIESHVLRLHGVPSRLKEPMRRNLQQETGEIMLHRWQLVVDTDPYRRDLPNQRVRIEVAGIPAHTREVHSLRENYEYLPDGYADALIPVESREEILADKLIAFPCSQDRYVRHKDIWDLSWLRRRGVALNAGLVMAKIGDYSVDRYMDRLDSAIERLPEIVTHGTFRQRMQQFLPADKFEELFGNPDFEPFLVRDVTALLRETKGKVGRDGVDLPH